MEYAANMLYNALNTSNAVDCNSCSVSRYMGDDKKASLSVSGTCGFLKLSANWLFGI